MPAMVQFYSFMMPGEKAADKVLLLPALLFIFYFFQCSDWSLILVTA